MPPRLDARMAVFPYHQSLAGHVADCGSIFGIWKHGLGDADVHGLAMVHWTADPTLGLPVAPFRVEIMHQGSAASRLDLLHVELDLTPRTGHRIDMRRYAPSDVGLFVMFCRCETTNPDDHEVAVYALDDLQREIPGSRRIVATDGPAPQLFLGPGIFGLAATGDVKLTEVRFADEPGFDATASVDVAPHAPDIAAFAFQEYFGCDLYLFDALDLRREMDGLTTVLPQRSELQAFEASERGRYANLTNSSLLRHIGNNFEALVMNPAAAPLVAVEEAAPGDGSDHVEGDIDPVSMLQFLGATGPMEASVMGCGVTVPLSTWMPTTGETMAEHLVGQESYFPVQLVKVTGWFWRSDENSAVADGDQGFVDDLDADAIRSRPRVHEVSTFARLVPPPESVTAEARVLRQRRPAALDGPGSADVGLTFRGETRSHVWFVERLRRESKAFMTGVDGVPQPILAVDTESLESSEAEPHIVDHDVARPLTGNVRVSYELHARDEFGRWAEHAGEASVSISAWSEPAPRVLSGAIVPGPGGALLLEVAFALDWSVRTQRQVRFGVRIGDRDDEAGLVHLEPEHNVRTPAYGSDDRALLLRFQGGADGDVAVVSDGAGPSAPSAWRDDQEDGSALRSYRVRLHLGAPDVVFADGPTRVVAIVADAASVVGGDSWSPKSPVLFVTALDPRPPVLEASPWTLVWTALPSGDGVARVALPAPAPSAVTGSLEGFIAWRAHEASIIDLVLELQPSAEAMARTLLGERDLGVRFRMLENLVRLADATASEFRSKFIEAFEAASTTLFAPGSSIELGLPERQSGLELVMLSAVSRTGVPSDKRDLAYVRGVAVPRARPMARPWLRVYPPRDQGTIGPCLFVVGSTERFDANDVRLFWDDADWITDGDQVLYPLTDVTHVSFEQAERHHPDIGATIDADTIGYDQCFLASPPRRWWAVACAVELRVAGRQGAVASESSPRSAIAQYRLPPLTRPELEVASRHEGDARPEWDVALRNVPLATAHAFGRSQLFVECIGDDGHVVRLLEPVPLDRLVSRETEVPPVASQTGGWAGLTVRGGPSPSVRVTTDDRIARTRIVVSDPLGRTDEAVLEREG